MKDISYLDNRANLTEYNMIGMNIRIKQVNAIENSPAIVLIMAIKHSNTRAAGIIKLGSSLIGGTRPLIDKRFDWPRQISFLNIGIYVLSSPKWM